MKNKKTIYKQTLVIVCAMLFLSSPLLAKKRSSLERGKSAFQRGKMRTALTYLDKAIERAPSVKDRNTAYYYLGLAFYEMGYFFSSYQSFRRILSMPDPANKKLYGKAIKNAILIMDGMGHVERIGKILDRLPESYVPTKLNHMVHYARGVHHYYSGNLSSADSHLKSVNPESQFYYKANFYLGVIATKKKKYKDAIFYFKKVEKLTRNKRKKNDIEDLAKLNLARSIYSSGNMEKAVRYYARFTSKSPYWVTILLESSWPLMRLNDTTVSLGNLHTITSPFYRENMVGEAYILKSTVLYALCKYEEMRKTLSEFFDIYDPVLQQMRVSEKNLDSSLAFYRAYKARKGLSPAFIGYIDTDPGVAKSIRVEKVLLKERARLSRFRRIKQVKAMKTAIDKMTDFIGVQVGRKLRTTHRRKLKDLVFQREQANYLKVEIVTGEKDLIEKTRGLPPKRVTDVETEVYEDYRFWPYKGEYWKDELGTYVYTTESACID